MGGIDAGEAGTRPGDAERPERAAVRPGGFDLVVLAGGTARRFGGADKVLLPVRGRPMLERVVAAGAAAGAVTTVVVGPARALASSTSGPIHWTREDPAGAGPLAALAAGLHLGTAPVVVVLAADMPLVDPSVVRLLVETACQGEVDGALLVDADGRRQPLAAAYGRAPLDQALASVGDLRNQPMRHLLTRLTLADVTDPVAALDCDTPEDLAYADRLAGESGSG